MSVVLTFQAGRSRRMGLEALLELPGCGPIGSSDLCLAPQLEHI